MGSILEYLIIHYRWVFVFFLLPVSTSFKIFLFTRNWIAFKFKNSKVSHFDRVRHVQGQVLEWSKTDRTVPICTARPSWMTMSHMNQDYKKKFYNVDVSLNDILEIDTTRKIITVEPLVTIGQLSSLLLPLGWTLPIMPELEDLTIGGLIMGTGVESSSHKYGLFQHTCNRFELVMADGSVIQCSKEENSDLFYSVPWSHGTLGLLVSAEIQIIPAKKFVKINYRSIFSKEDLINKLKLETSRTDASDFVEVITFNDKQAVIMTADMTDDMEKNKLNEIGKPYKTWFYKHVEKYLDKEGTEYIPLVDYYHRHSRSIFWELQYIIPFGNHFLFRWLFGWILPIKISLLKLTESKTISEMYEKHHMIQDMLVPLKHLQRTLEFFDQTVKIFPLWICPFVLPANPGFVHPTGKENEMFIDVGAYGEPKVEFDAEKTTRKIEEFVRSINGFQMLYAMSYMTKAEFRKMFDHNLYDIVRAKYTCEEAFPDVYDKVSRNARIGKL